MKTVKKSHSTFIKGQHKVCALIPPLWTVIKDHRYITSSFLPDQRWICASPLSFSPFSSVEVKPSPCINMYVIISIREILLNIFFRSIVSTQGHCIECYSCESRESNVCEETIQTCPGTDSCSSTRETKYGKSRLMEWKWSNAIWLVC